MGRGHIVTTVQLLQSGARADSAGQILGLALGYGALKAGAGLDPRALEVVGSKPGRVERTTDQYRAGDRAR